MAKKKRRDVTSAQPPFTITAWLLCERVERDELDRPTLHRITHILERGRDGTAAFNGQLFLSATGLTTGTYRFTSHLRFPSGEVHRNEGMGMTVNEKNALFDYAMGIEISTAELGLHWFDLWWGERLLCALPITVIDARPAIVQ